MRPWRLVLVTYAVLLTTATHWPQLRFRPDAPASDKLIHLIAFGGLTILLWQTRWFRRRSTVVLLALAWSVIDELSQGLMQRSVSGYDLTANALGVTVAGVWLWALRPVGGPVNRMRLRQEAFILNAAFARRGTWTGLVLITAIAAVPIVLLWFRGGAWPFYITVIVWAHAAGGWVLHRTRGARRRLREMRPCFACNAPCVGMPLDDQGRGRCPGCGVDVRAVQWTEFVPPPRAQRAALVAAAIAIGMAIVIAAFVLILLTAPVYGWLIDRDPTMAGPPRAAHFIGGLERTLGRVVDLTLFALVLAATVRLYRRRLARHYDQSTRCRRCGHDLRATPAAQGVGRCGECGAEFALVEGET